MDSLERIRFAEACVNALRQGYDLQELTSDLTVDLEEGLRRTLRARAFDAMNGLPDGTALRAFDYIRQNAYSVRIDGGDCRSA